MEKNNPSIRTNHIQIAAMGFPLTTSPVLGLLQGEIVHINNSKMVINCFISLQAYFLQDCPKRREKQKRGETRKQLP